jgi:hypothetical protein
MDRRDDTFLKRVGRPRIAARQVDELIGLARGIAADDVVTAAEVEMLKSWLAVNQDITGEPIMKDLAARIDDVLADGTIDAEECGELLQTLKGLCGDASPGELLKSTSLPLCKPAPPLSIVGTQFCFTGTFNFGTRKVCEQAVKDRGGQCGALTMKTSVLVVGVYATESWKHSAYGTKIIRASQWRDQGASIAIVGENHWRTFL